MQTMPWTRHIALAVALAAATLPLGPLATPARAMLADGGGGGGRTVVNEPRRSHAAPGATGQNLMSWYDSLKCCKFLFFGSIKPTHV